MNLKSPRRSIHDRRNRTFGQVLANGFIVCLRLATQMRHETPAIERIGHAGPRTPHG